MVAVQLVLGDPVPTRWSLIPCDLIPRPKYPEGRLPPKVRHFSQRGFGKVINEHTIPLFKPARDAVLFSKLDFFHGLEIKSAQFLDGDESDLDDGVSAQGEEWCE